MSLYFGKGREEIDLEIEGKKESEWEAEGKEQSLQVKRCRFGQRIVC